VSRTCASTDGVTRLDGMAVEGTQVRTMSTRLRHLVTALSAVVLAVGVVSLPMPTGAAPVKDSTIRGTVYGAAGSPLARATVIAYALPGLRAGCATSPHEWTQVASTTSGSTGAYTISGLAAGHYRIGVFPRNLAVDSFGYLLATTYSDDTYDGANVSPTVYWADDVVAPSSGDDVRLAVPGSISGRVTDDSTGASVAGVEVRAFNTGQWEPTYPWTVTGADGSPTGSPGCRSATSRTRSGRTPRTFPAPRGTRRCATGSAWSTAPAGTSSASGGSTT
jgi:hypothetical protein